MEVGDDAEGDDAPPTTPEALATPTVAELESRLEESTILSSAVIADPTTPGEAACMPHECRGKIRDNHVTSPQSSRNAPRWRVRYLPPTDGRAESCHCFL